MERIKILSFVSLIPLFLSGCAGYVEPTSGPLATVSTNTSRNGLFTWSESQITAIDNQQTSHYWGKLLGAGTQFNVTPGPHSFVIHTRFNQGFGSGPYMSTAQVYANTRPNMNYQFISRTNGSNLNVWAIDKATGKKASAVVSAPYFYEPRSTTTVVYVHH